MPTKTRGEHSKPQVKLQGATLLLPQDIKAAPKYIHQAFVHKINQMQESTQ